MKIVICNVPLRSDEFKTNYPPLGVLAVIQSLQSAGYVADFYDINFFRPSDEEIKSFFMKNRFDVVGISATVSTSYKYVKRLTAIIKSVCPQAVIVAGGALTASSEIVLKFNNNVDFCVIGEGEKVIVNLVDYISSNGTHKSEQELRKIKGLCFLNSKGEVVFTGYEKQLSIDEIQDPDYRLLQEYSNINQYIIDPFIDDAFFKYDQRSDQEHRRDKRLATVVTSRGCVNRCTYCYRWQRGIRIFSVDRVVRYIQFLIENFNVRFISFGDENFGAAKKWIEEFVEKIKPLDILYRIGGICCENIDPLILKKLRDSGCVAIQYGFESGSNRMLKVMEKGADAELNTKVATWTRQVGLQTVPALLVGMPGESYETIRETTEFVKRITESLPREPIITPNAPVVLPGTPIYEYAKYRGLLGKGLDGEERYLLRISNWGGASTKHLNLTDYPYFVVLGWIRCISIEARNNYRKKNNLSSLPLRKLLGTLLRLIFKRRENDGSLSEILYSQPLFYYLRYIISPLVVMYKNYKEDKRLFFQRCFELLMWPLKKKSFTEYISLRSLLKEKVQDLKNTDPQSIQILRLGR